MKTSEVCNARAQKLIRSETRERKLLTAYHQQVFKKEMRGGKKCYDCVNNAELEGFLKDIDIFDSCLFLRSKYTGSWMTVWGTVVTGTVLPAMEFSDFLCAHYNSFPPNL